MTTQTHGRRLPAVLVVLLALSSAAFTLWMWTHVFGVNVIGGSGSLLSTFSNTGARPHIVLLDARFSVEGETLSVASLPIDCTPHPDRPALLVPNLSSLVLERRNGGAVVMRIPQVCHYWRSHFVDNARTVDDTPPADLLPVVSLVDDLADPHRSETILSARAHERAGIRVDQFRLSLPETERDPELVRQSEAQAAASADALWARFAADGEGAAMVGFGLIGLKPETWRTNEPLAAYVADLPTDRLSILPLLARPAMTRVARLPNPNRTALRRTERGETSNDAEAPQPSDKDVRPGFVWSTQITNRDVAMPFLSAPLDCVDGRCVARFDRAGIMIEQRLDTAARDRAVIDIDGWQVPLAMMPNRLKPEVTDLPIIFDPRSQTIYLVQRHCREAACPGGATWPFQADEG